MKRARQKTSGGVFEARNHVVPTASGIPEIVKHWSPLFLCAVLSVFGAGCGNMKKQPNFRALTPNPHFANGSTARHAPANTVPHGSVEAQLTSASLAEIDSMANAPVPLTREFLERGRERFDIYCAVCHGADGYGHGLVVRRGFPTPPSYHEERLLQAPLGHFYAVITRGYGTMYSYADRVPDRDRWAIAAYIRVLQRSQHASLADVPEEHRVQLSSP